MSAAVWNNLTFSQENLSYLPWLIQLVLNTSFKEENCHEIFLVISLAALNQFTLSIFLCITECIIKCNGDNIFHQQSRDLAASSRFFKLHYFQYYSLLIFSLSSLLVILWLVSAYLRKKFIYCPIVHYFDTSNVFCFIYHSTSDPLKGK